MMNSKLSVKGNQARQTPDQEVVELQRRVPPFSIQLRLPSTKNLAGSSKESSKMPTQVKTMPMPEERRSTLSSSTGCTSIESRFSGCWTDSKGETASNLKVLGIKEKVGMSASDRSVHMTTLPMMVSGQSVDGGLLDGKRTVMTGVQRATEKTESWSSPGRTKPIDMQSTETIETYPLPIRRTKFGNITYSTRGRHLKTSRAKSRSLHFPYHYGKPYSSISMSTLASSMPSKEDGPLMKKSSTSLENSSSSLIKLKQRVPSSIKVDGYRPSKAMPMQSLMPTP